MDRAIRGEEGEGWLLSCSSHCSFDIIILVINSLQKKRKEKKISGAAILWWGCFLIDRRMESLLMPGEGLQGLCQCVCACVCVDAVWEGQVCVCVYVSAWRVSPTRGFTSVPLSLWGPAPSTLVRACPRAKLHLQTKETVHETETHDFFPSIRKSHFQYSVSIQ